MTSQLKGGKELQELLSQLPAKIEANIVRGGLRAGAKVLVGAIKAGVPVHLGILRDSIRISTSLRDGKVKVVVKTGSAKAWYAHLVEYGTKSHEIVAKDGKSLFIGGIFRTNVHHPGAQAKPFVRPALDANEQRAMDTAMNYMVNRLKTKHGLETPELESDES